MFCSQCGTETSAGARFCSKCGNSVDATTPAQPQAQYSHAPIWNPSATANWSLVFTPAFGAYLQMRNWEALGEHEKSAGSRSWFYVSLGVLALYILMGMFVSDSKASEAFSRLLGFTFLLTWYFASGRAQARYVKERFGADYTRKPWGKALLAGVGALVGYFVVAFIVGFVLAVAHG